MINLYFYIPNQIVNDIVFSGLSLSRWSEREGTVLGIHKRCIAALLSPRDDMNMYKSADHSCVRLSIQKEYCCVADNYLYEVGKNIPEVMDMYWRNLIPVNEYKFGTFIKPEALIYVTVIPGRIAPADEKADFISVIGDNRDLYLSNYLEMLQSTEDDLKNKLLYQYYKELVAAGRYTEYHAEDAGGKSVFVDSEGNYVALDRPAATQEDHVYY